MSASKHPSRWTRLTGEMVVPALLLGYATQYYLSVARMPRPETNLLLISPVYWLLLVCCVVFAGLRLRDAVRERQTTAEEPAKPHPGLDLAKSSAFIVLTGACIWAIPTIGFVVSTVAYTFLLLLALGVRSLPILLLTPTLLIGVLWVGMEYYLNLRLPTGFLF